MKTIEIQCKQFDEWDEKTREKILERYRDINVDHDGWYDGEFEYWSGELEKMGYDITDTEFKDEYKVIDGKRTKTGNRVPYTIYQIAFSGFWSQGDGASFTGKIDPIKWIEYNHLQEKYGRIVKLLQSGAIQGTGEIKRDRWHHYVHWNTTSIYWDWYMNGNHPRIEALLDELEEDILKHHQDLNKEIYRSLEQCYESETEDESVADTLKVNEYEFDSNGKIW